MPFVTAIASRLAPSVNAYEETVTALGANHLWLFDETSGATANDSIGNWNVNVYGQRVHRRIIGGTRGEPRTFSVACGVASTNAFDVTLTDPADIATRLSSATGVVGGFLGMASADSSADAHWLINHEWGSSFVYGRFRVWINDEGQVRVLVDQIGGATTLVADWRWTSAAVRNAWKANDGDTRISGTEFPHIIVVQRGDGTGPKLMINGGAELAPDVENLSGVATSDTWWDDTNALNSSGSLRIRLRQSGSASRLSGVFVIEGTPPSTAELQSIYASANTDGQITDYCEYVAACKPFFWKPLTHGGVTSSASFDDSWWLHNEYNVAAFAAGASAELMHERWFRADLNKTDWDATTLPGMAYSINALPGGNGTYIQTDDNNGNWTDNVTAANDFDTGTICVVYEVPNVTSGLQFVFGAQTVSGTGLLRIQHVTGSLAIITRASSGNENQINLDIPTSGIAIGDTIMLVVNQIGTGYQVFVNGVLRDGGDIGATLNGTATGAEWFHTLRLTNRWRWTIGTNPNAVSSNFLTTPIYDFWIKTGTPLSARQVRDLWDVTKGNKAQVPVPVFL
ncbi:MAG: hypothetical protein V2I24_09270 [Halieaceae bacterium]|jgi:hypothetical protein|nr:hypothetical protein [Halieaceae bacterium]